MTMPERTDEELLSYRHHDLTDPVSYLNRLEMAYAAVRVPPCPTCGHKVRLIPMHGTAWGLEHEHRPRCPELDQ